MKIIREPLTPLDAMFQGPPRPYTPGSLKRPTPIDDVPKTEPSPPKDDAPAPTPARPKSPDQPI